MTKSRIDAAIDSVVVGFPIDSARCPKACAVILVGLQYAGKSSMAKALTDHGFIHVWGTLLKSKFGLDNDELLVVSESVVKAAMRAGVNVVVDAVNAKHQARQRLVEAANDSGGIGRVLFLDVPKEVRLERRAASLIESETPGRRTIGLDEMEMFEREFESPQPDEPLVVVHRDWKLGEVLDQLGVAMTPSRQIDDIGRRE